MVKRVTVVLLGIVIATLASAVSLCLYRPAPATGPQGSGGQSNLKYLVVGPDGHGSIQTSIPVKQASLSALPTAIQSLSISDEGPSVRGWVPRDQQHIITRVLAWLKTAAPYEGKIPLQPTTLIIGDYVGPSQLYLTTPDRGQLDIYPAYYYKVSKQNGWTEVQANYVPDVIVLWSPAGVSYFQSAQLYGWLRTDRWKTDFIPE